MTSSVRMAVCSALIPRRPYFTLLHYLLPHNSLRAPLSCRRDVRGRRDIRRFVLGGWPMADDLGRCLRAVYMQRGVDGQ